MALIRPMDKKCYNAKHEYYLVLKRKKFCHSLWNYTNEPKGIILSDIIQSHHMILFIWSIYNTQIHRSREYDIAY